MKTRKSMKTTFINKRNIILIVILLFVSHSNYAQLSKADSLTLDQAIELTINNYPLIKQQQEMTKAAVELGLSEDVAKKLVLQTAKGAALLAAERDKEGETPAVLRKKVTSPGGTTEAALKIFADGDFGPLVTAALTRARDRGRELAK